MAISYNRSIVTSNLIALFDPGNPRSYSGSGTTFRDCSGNGYTGTLINNPSYSSVNGGVFVMNGVNTGIDIPNINMSTTNYTIIGASRFNINIGGRVFSAKNNNWLMGQWSTTTENYYAEGWVSTTGAGSSDTLWRIYAATGNIAADSYSLYVNGVLTAGPNNGGSAGPNGFYIGSYIGTSEFSYAHVGILMVYNTVLTAAQIQQNFNAYRGRYGL